MSQRTIFLIASSFLLILAFQNCAQQNGIVFSDPSSKIASDTDENGRPYDGKIFILLGDTCPDGTKIKSRIVLKTESEADLVRHDCNEIAPVALSPSEFQFDSNNSEELVYANQVYTNMLVGTKLDFTTIRDDFGFCYLINFDSGTLPDDTNNLTQSRVQIYEDGKPLGPAHSAHNDIRNIGLGRFSHWLSGISTLRFSASDNTDPRTNGRTYTWDLR